MKTKVFLISLTLSCLWGCHQEQVEQQNEKDIRFTSVVVGDGNQTRSLDSAIDIISIRTDIEKAFTVFNIMEETRSWSEFGNANKLQFYAHYPRLSDNVSGEETRELTGGTDYLFGTATAVAGQQQVCLHFKRMTSPLQIEVYNADGSIYQGKVKITAMLKNRGVQNLKTGAISTFDEKGKVALVNGYGRSANLFPQVIQKGTEFCVELGDGRKYSVKTSANLTLNSGSGHIIVIKGDGTLNIVDPPIPL